MPDDSGLAWAEAMRDRQEPPEPKPVLHCAGCGDGIYEGEEYYEIDGKTLCLNCMEMRYQRYAYSD